MGKAMTMKSKSEVRFSVNIRTGKPRVRLNMNPWKTRSKNSISDYDSEFNDAYPDYVPPPGFGNGIQVKIIASKLIFESDLL